MIHYIYGASGSGKTHAMLDLLRADASQDKKAFFIVPEQETVTIERSVLDLIPHTSCISIEVLNFSRLCNRIFRVLGGISYNFATAPIKSLIMWNTLRELSPMLEEYGNGGVCDPSLTASMLAAVSELKSYCIAPQRLDAACARLKSDSPIYKKMRDISLIYSAYTSELSEHFSDNEDDISKALSLLKESGGAKLFAGSSVYIDSFSGFTRQELDLIGVIGGLCDDLYISLPLPSPNDISIHTESLRHTLAQLKKTLAGERYDETYMTEDHRTQSDALHYLSRSLWSFSAEPFRGEVGEDITYMACETPYSEAERVACEIRRAINEGKRYGDIAIIVRDAEKYRGILDTALAKYSIPYFFSEKTDFMTKPLAKFLFGALRIKENGWRGEDVIAYLKSGFSGIDPFDADIFEDYVSTWNIHGNRFFDPEWTMNPDGYSASLSKRGERILKLANEIKDRTVPTLSLYFTRLDASSSVREMCEATLRFLSDSDVTEKVRHLCQKSLEAGDRRSAEEDMKLYSVLLSILYDLSEIFGERELTFSEFSFALSLMLSQSDIGAIPTRADEVTVGSASMLRTSAVKHTFIMGLNEGEFPASVKDGGIFTDADKRMLEELDLVLSADTSKKTSEELFFVLRAVSSPSERLTLSSSALSADGSSQRPSIVIGRIRRLFPTVTPQKDSECEITDRIWNDALLKEIYPSLIHCKGSEALRSLMSDTADTEVYLSRLEIPLSRSKCKISRDVIDKIFGERISLTSSRLEKYIMCGFDYYCTYVLGLRESKKAVFQLNNIGTFIHYILESFMREITASGEIDLTIDDERISEILQRSVKNYLFELLGEDYAISNRTRHLFARLNRLSFMIAKELVAEFRDSDFYPTYFELGIGMQDSNIRSIEFELKDGRRIYLRGIADRVDTYKKDGNVYIRVVDYKTGSKEFSLDDLKYGLNAQLLIYLFSLCYAQTDEKKAELGAEPNGRIIPAGIQYLSSNAPVISLDSYHTDAEIEGLIQSKFSRSGLLTSDPDILRAINHDLDSRIVSKVKEMPDGSISGRGLASEEAFDSLYSQLTDAIVAVAESMTDGNASALPLKGSKSSPCRFCKMRSICRSSRSDKR